MRRSVVVLLTLALPLTAALAQQTATIPAVVRPSRTVRHRLITLEQKLRYICKQLDLNEKQRQHVEGLFAILEEESNATPESIRESLDQIQVVYQEMTAARESGKTALAEELRQKLENLAPEVQAENHFADGIRAALTDEQWEKFTRLRKELASATELSLRPAQVVEVARRFKLTAEQEKKLADLQTEFRRQINNIPDEEQRRTALLNQLVQDVAALLEPVQRAEFQKEIDKLRPDEPAKPAATQPATTQPATTPPARTQPAKPTP